MEPQQESPAVQPPSQKNKKKGLLWAVIGLSVLLALAIAVIIVLATKPNNTDTSNGNGGDTNQSNEESKDDNSNSTVTPSKDIVTVDTQESGVSLTITGMNKSGTTLTINYKLNHNTDEERIYASAFSAGVYTLNYKAAMSEPYFISDNDNQKYGLVKDSSGQPLASKDVSAQLKKGESVNGYITITLPPNNSKGSLSLGNISIPNLTIKY